MCLAQSEQREAAGAGEERGEHSVQPGHPLRQPDGLPARTTGHQQKQAAALHACSRLGERQQQHPHEQARDFLLQCLAKYMLFTIH